MHIAIYANMLNMLNIGGGIYMHTPIYAKYAKYRRGCILAYIYITVHPHPTPISKMGPPCSPKGEMHTINKGGGHRPF